MPSETAPRTHRLSTMHATTAAHGLFAALAAILTVLSLSAPLAAQYIPPGRPVDPGEIPPQEALETNLKNARWNLGKLRLSPWLGVRNASFVSNVTTRTDAEGEDDFTVTVGAGIRGYWRTGPKVLWAVQALPEYVWWQDTDSKRRVNGRYGIGAFGYFNRLKFEASAQRLEVQSVFTPELQQLTSTREDRLRLAVDFEFVRRFHLVLANELTELANQEDETLIFRRLDRDEDGLQAILRFQGSHLTFGIGYEDKTTDFATTARQLSNTETAELAEFIFDGNRFDAAIRLARRCLEPEAGSNFQTREETTGYLDLLWETGQRSALLLYGRRNLYYALTDLNSSVLNTRYGARFEIGGRKAVFAWFAEVGDDDFDALPSVAVRRADDVTSAGVQMAFKFRRLLQAGLRISETDYDSNIDAFDRDFLTISTSIELGEILRRLRLGSDGDEW